MQNRLPLIFILLTVTLDAIGIGLIFPVMPDLIRSVTHGDLSQAAIWGGILSTSFAVMQFLFGPVIGSLSDRYGRRPILLVSLLIMGLDYIVLALAPTIWLLLLGRIVAGIAAATYSTATAFIADITPPEQRGARFGLIGACFGVGFVLGPLMGGLLSTLSLHAPFFAAAILAFANLALGYFVLPETVTDDTRRPFALSRANPAGALRAVARLPGLRRVLVTFLILGIAMNVYPAIWAYFGQARFGWDSRMVGISLAIYGISFAIGQALLVGPMIRRFGEHRAAHYGMWVDITTLAALGLVTSGTAALVITPVTALGGAVTPALQALASRSAPADAQGELQGVLASLNAIAMITAPLVMTSIFSAFTAPSAPVYAPGAPFLLASALMVLALVIHLGNRPKA
ncbi:TCR/Tet family MFS transporter [Paragemmobacter straminiformis]|uniref:TCR/Tet family MFS transporter n=1 Tax=Paragemmobacter straminiformis TaxID=2045119 RepID=A0A842IC59_9RHOB|nr:TCR/Tet family MFS transporter [Gemmobacter straminiformis]MBC2837003.1 TCR/Tet family MFS transporter [Gemmobacter straminiformis]